MRPHQPVRDDEVLPFDPTFTADDRQRVEALSGGTGISAAMSATNYATICLVAEQRLLIGLCRREPPDETDPRIGLYRMILANFVKAIWSTVEAGVRPIQRLHPREFDVIFANGGKVEMPVFWNTWADVITLFSRCRDQPVSYQSDLLPLMYAPDGLHIDDVHPDLPPGGVI